MRVRSTGARLFTGLVLAVSAALVTTFASIVLGKSTGLLVGIAAGALLLLVFRITDSRLIESERRLVQLERWSALHLSTLESLALAVDARDQAAPRHARRAPQYAIAVGRALGLSDTDIQGLQVAALLLDVGKLAVPDSILSKSGPLTQAEFQKLRTHPQVGADIVAGVPFPYPVSEVIGCHHERWDGNGYPGGLEGDAIPLGARILAVVDYFEGLTADRPSHRTLAPEAALELLRQESGRAFDPLVVQTFLEVHPSVAGQSDAVTAPEAGTIAVPGERGPDTEAVKTSVLRDIALGYREVHSLNEIAQAAGSTLSVAETMTLVASRLGGLVPFSTCALFLRDGQPDSLRCAFATGLEAQAISSMTIAEGQGLNGWVARTRRPLVNGLPSDDFDAAGRSAQPTALQSGLVCPLLIDGRCIGTLAVYHTRPGMYDEDHRRLLERIAEQTAALIHRSRVFEQTQADSLTDALTGLPNTRFMVMHVGRELARAARLRSEVALLLMDLDHFKEINDTYGHHVGDRALRAVGDAIRSAMRPYDICVRYAGDEFVAVLSGCGPEEAERKRVDVQAAVSAMPFEPRAGERRELTISAGAAVYPRDGENHEQLVAAADGRMYRDKQRRRNEEAVKRIAQSVGSEIGVKDGTTGMA